MDRVQLSPLCESSAVPAGTPNNHKRKKASSSLSLKLSSQVVMLSVLPSSVDYVPLYFVGRGAEGRLSSDPLNFLDTSRELAALFRSDFKRYSGKQKRGRSKSSTVPFNVTSGEHPHLRAPIPDLCHGTDMASDFVTCANCHALTEHEEGPSIGLAWSEKAFARHCDLSSSHGRTNVGCLSSTKSNAEQKFSDSQSCADFVSEAVSTSDGHYKINSFMSTVKTRLEQSVITVLDNYWSRKADCSSSDGGHVGDGIDGSIVRDPSSSSDGICASSSTNTSSSDASDERVVDEIDVARRGPVRKGDVDADVEIEKARLSRDSFVGQVHISRQHDNMVFSSGPYVMIRSHALDVALDLFHECSYDTDACLHRLDLIIEDLLILWTPDEKISLFDGLQKFGADVRKVAACVPSKRSPDVLDFFFSRVSKWIVRMMGGVFGFSTNRLVSQDVDFYPLRQNGASCTVPVDLLDMWRIHHANRRTAEKAFVDSSYTCDCSDYELIHIIQSQLSISYS